MTSINCFVKHPMSIQKNKSCLHHSFLQHFIFSSSFEFNVNKKYIQYIEFPIFITLFIILEFLGQQHTMYYALKYFIFLLACLLFSVYLHYFNELYLLGVPATNNSNSNSRVSQPQTRTRNSKYFRDFRVRVSWPFKNSIREFLAY